MVAPRMDRTRSASLKGEHEEADVVVDLSCEHYGPAGMLRRETAAAISRIIWTNGDWVIQAFVGSLLLAMSLFVPHSVPLAACCLVTSTVSPLYWLTTAITQRERSNTRYRSQGVISVILVMESFLGRFHQVSDTAPGAGFYKGLMTAMITLGAFVGRTCPTPVLRLLVY